MEVLKGQLELEVRTKEVVVAEIKATINHVQQVAILGSIAIGNNLKELKDLVPHGQWLEYIQDNLHWNERKVQRFIQVSEKYGDENSAYHRLILNPTLTTDLSFTKALSLLSIDENEVESFIENNDVNDMTVKQLEEKIKELKEEKSNLTEQYKKEIDDLKEELREAKDNFADTNTAIETLKSEIDELKKENEDLQNEDNTEDNSEALEELEEELKQKLKELDDTIKQKDKLEQKLSDLEQKQQEAEKTKKEEIEEAVANAKEEAAKEAREEMKAIVDEAEKAKEKAIEQKELAEKKLNNSSDEEIIKFKIKVDELQVTIIDIAELLNVIQNADKEKANKLRTAVKSIIENIEI